ncbi:MAG: TolC family protein [Chitinophaga sp.]|uniref:TolC family protein n=1 Tax=Chitinophaga sp. TaxID=1869181 RepID=UPI0025C3DBCD|nr:TolC family protein [Chitinophaga sp.]MBV8251152.1 TolC family protein [Chitinophaga sp.]
MNRIILILLFPFYASAQEKTWTMQRAVDMALTQNKGLKSADAKVNYYRQMVPVSGEIGKTDVALQYGQYNSYVKNDNNISISQTIPFPTTFAAKKKLGESMVEEAKFLKVSTRNDLVYQVKESWLQLLFLKEQRQLLLQQDSLFGSFAKSADLRYRTGETKMLEKTAADARKQEVMNLLRQNQADNRIYIARLKALLGVADSTMLPEMQEGGLSDVSLQLYTDTAAVAAHPYLRYLQQQVITAEKQQQVYAAAILPDITLGYFNQSLIGTPVNASGAPLATGSNRFQGIQVGLALPLWARPLKAKVKAEKQQQEAAHLSYENGAIQLKSQFVQALQQYAKQMDNLEYYHNTALPNAALILKQSQLAYNAGEIGYAEHFLNLEQVLGIRQGYLKALLDNKQAACYITYLSGNQQ